MPLDFPSSPTNGQLYSGYVYDAARGVWSHFDYLSGTSLLGTIYAWPLEDIPSWALELNGQAVSRTTYSGLFALLGTTYGAGNGTTTFNLPDYRGRTLVGKDSSQTEFDVVGEAGGAKTHTLTVDEMPSHTHTQNAHAHGAYHRNTAYKSGTGDMPGADAISALDAYTYAFNVDTGSTIATNQNTGGDGAHNNLQPYTVVKWIICAVSSTGDFNTEVQTALVTRVSDTPLSQNFILNGAFDVWQRGTSVTPTSTVTYSADRWESFRLSFAGNLVVSRQTNNGPTGFTQYVRVERVKDSTNTEAIYFGQPLESLDSKVLAGKTVTLSFYIRRGSGYSGTSNLLNARILSGTGTDQVLRGVITGQTAVASSSITLTTAFQRFSITGTVPTNSNQVFIVFDYTPTGTAPSADRFELTGVQLEIGDTPTPFRRANPTLQGEIAACQRYYEVSVSSGAISQYVGTGVTYTASSMYAMLPFKVEKRIVPAAVITNGTNFWGFDRAGAMDQFSTLQAASSPQTTRQLGVVFASAELAGTAGQSGILMTQNAGASLAWNAEL